MLKVPSSPSGLFDWFIVWGSMDTSSFVTACSDLDVTVVSALCARITSL